MGFTPQFVDLDKDGRMDIITGQYSGHVTWFRGIEGGFDDGQLLEQEGNPDSIDIRFSSSDDVRSQFYWLYSAANFGDFDDDGLLDMIVGGISFLRISRNIGTKAQPKFAHRELLLDINDKPLKIVKSEKNPQAFFSVLVSPLVVDWDQDGILDLLATNRYTEKGLPAVTFFRGVKTVKGHRFEPGIPLFRSKDGTKVLPGRYPHINVCDWNDDGVNDLLIGTSVVTLHDDVFNGYLSWNWERETGLGSNDPGNSKDYKRSQDNAVREYLERKTVKEKIPAEDYRTLRHRGYVYVMLGEKEN